MIPGPSDAQFDAALADKAERYSIQLHQLLTLPIGFGLDAKISDPDNVALVDSFFESGETDFQAFSGKHPYEIVEDYGDYFHASIFGGVQIAGDAFRYAVLRDQGAPTEALASAREDLLADLDALDWLTRITGVSGVVARGIRRVRSEPGEPEVPGELPELLPMFDENGDPFPRYKGPVWRADGSGELPHLIWLDDGSRDTLVGYIFAMGAAYDVALNDPMIPQEKVQRLAEHARAIGHRLLEEVDVGDDEKIDLVIRDADGRPTTFHALSAEEVLEGIVSVEASNGFNAIMSLGILRTLYHVSGDHDIWDRYQQLLGPRDYLGVAKTWLADTTYFNEITNYSLVNMLFIAYYGVLRYENDPDIALRVRRIFETETYDVGVDRDPRGLGQSFFDFIFVAFRERGVLDIGEQALSEGLQTLVEHRAPPYWDRYIRNCDDGEIETRDCVLTDGTEAKISGRRGYGGERVVAETPIPMRVRPPTNYMWRMDPHMVNGGGQDRLNSGGDFHTAYWMGRFLRATESGLDNISAQARGAPPPRPESEDGCTCTAQRTRSAWPLLLAFVALFCIRRRS